MSANDFDFEQVFDEDYLYFYEPMLAKASEADAAMIWRLLALEPGLELLDLAGGSQINWPSEALGSPVSMRRPCSWSARAGKPRHAA